LDDFEEFFHICIRKNHNFIVNDFIAHNMQIYIKLLDGKTLKLDSQPTDSILSIKLKIFKEAGI
jgi:hypothetical protein